MKNDPTVLTTPDYRRFIEDLKARVTEARVSAARHVSRDLILLYWDIGRAIMEKQKTLGWGDSVVEMVARDLRRAFPEMRGFSPDSIWRMRQFYLEYADPSFLEQAVPEMERRVGKRLEQAVPESAGRYVGIAPEEDNENFDFEEALRDIHVGLEDLNAEAVQLAATIKKNFEELGI
jgi:hypothetical protein